MGIYYWNYTSRFILENRRKYFGSTIEWIGLERVFHHRCSDELQGVYFLVTIYLRQIGRADRTQRRIASWYIESTSIHNVRRDGFDNNIPYNPNNELLVRP